MTRKRILSFAAVALLAAAAVCALLFVQKRSRPYPMTEKTGIAMDTIVGCKLYGAPAGAEAAALNVVSSLENAISRFREGSDVWTLNETGSVKSTLLPALLAQCRPLEEQSGGAFDLTVGPLSTLWGFGTDDARLPAQSEIDRAKAAVDYTGLAAEGSTVTVREGQQVDLGSVGKGLACDMVKQYLQSAGVKGGVVSVGGSICVFGKKNDKGEPWTVAVKHPREENRFLGYVKLREGFVSTSGDYEQYFEQGGKRYCHLLDATTGYPAESGLCSVTVVCQNGMLSDALSTVCFLLGKEKSEPILKAYDAAAVFVTVDGGVSAFGDLDFTHDES